MKAMSLLLALLLACTCGLTALAEEEDRTALAECAADIALWMNELRSSETLMTEGDTQAICSTINDTMRMTVAIFLDAMAADGDVTEAKGDMRLTAFTANEARGLYRSGTRWLAELGVYAEAELQQGEGYRILLLRLYDADGLLLGMQRVELGRREDAALLLLLDYDAVYDMTGRFAVRVGENGAETIYTKTLGRMMDIVLNAQEWSAGVEYGEWGRYQLLPATVLLNMD